MPNNQDPILAIRFHLTEIKRCYPITQRFDSSSNTHTSFKQQSSFHETIEILSRMLGVVIQKKLDFENDLKNNRYADAPAVPKGPGYFFELHRRESFPKDTCDEILTSHASDLYYYLHLTHEKIAICQ